MNNQVINSEQSLTAYKLYLDAQFEKHHYLRMDLKTGRQRSDAQNRALHLFFTNLSIALNDNGVDMRQFFSEGYYISWSPEIVKRELWATIQKAMFHTTSTTKLDRKQLTKVYEVLNRKVAECGIFVPFPSNEEKQ